MGASLMQRKFRAAYVGVVAGTTRRTDPVTPTFKSLTA